MNKGYKEIEILEIPLFFSLKEVVEELLRYKNNGELVCTSFNNHVLYSDTVTMDGAYLQVTGKTKAEFDKACKEWREECKRKEEEHNAKIPELSKQWIEAGHATLDEKYWDKWDECVPIRLEDLYRGMELGCCLDIVRSLNGGCTLEEAKKIIDNQGHSGMSHSLTVAMVRDFCDRGEEFNSYVH